MINCPDALAPTDEELLGLSYDEETLSVEEKAHFDQCPVCQQRLSFYRDMNNRLLTKFYRRLCPSAVRLNYYCLGVVPEAERVSIASHLLDCPRCTDEVAEIRQLQAAFEPFPEARPSLLTSIKRIFATLVVQQAQPVTRHDAQETGWPRQYRAGSLDLSIHLSRQPGGELMLLGILTSSDPTQTADAFTDIRVNLYLAPDPLRNENSEEVKPLLTTQVDDIGNLLLEPVPAGKYVLSIQLPEQEVIIEDLTIEHG